MVQEATVHVLNDKLVAVAALDAALTAATEELEEAERATVQLSAELQPLNGAVREVEARLQAARSQQPHEPHLSLEAQLATAHAAAAQAQARFDDSKLEAAVAAAAGATRRSAMRVLTEQVGGLALCPSVPCPHQQFSLWFV